MQGWHLEFTVFFGGAQPHFRARQKPLRPPNDIRRRTSCETFPRLLYQTRYGVDCFAAFPGRPAPGRFALGPPLAAVYYAYTPLMASCK